MNMQDKTQLCMRVYKSNQAFTTGLCFELDDIQNSICMPMGLQVYSILIITYSDKGYSN